MKSLKKYLIKPLLYAGLAVVGLTSCLNGCQYIFPRISTVPPYEHYSYRARKDLKELEKKMEDTSFVSDFFTLRWGRRHGLRRILDSKTSLKCR